MYNAGTKWSSGYLVFRKKNIGTQSRKIHIILMQFYIKIANL